MTPIIREEKEKRREEFYKKVQSVPIQDDHAIGLYQQCKIKFWINLFCFIFKGRNRLFPIFLQ